MKKGLLTSHYPRPLVPSWSHGVTFVDHEDHVHSFADPPKLTEITDRA